MSVCPPGASWPLYSQQKKKSWPLYRFEDGALSIHSKHSVPKFGLVSHVVSQVNTLDNYDAFALVLLGVFHPVWLELSVTVRDDMPHGLMKKMRGLINGGG